MTLWSTRTIDSNREKNYVVIKHKLRDINGLIHGVKFRGGYGVIDKNTKRYNEIRKYPFLKNTPEFPIIFLRKLKFVTRTKDVKEIWGQDVYHYYVKALTEVVAEEKVVKVAEEEKVHVQVHNKCSHRTKADGTLCMRDPLPGSPMRYCYKHILEDPIVETLNIKKPGIMTKADKVVYIQKIMKKLQKPFKAESTDKVETKETSIDLVEEPIQDYPEDDGAA
jgi:hypothetical protein